MDFKDRTKLKIAISQIREESDIAMDKKTNISIRKGLGIAACFAIIFSGIVYAKDIESYFKNLFTRSTEAMNTAVENGYIQKEVKDYIYDNNIGIKVDKLVLDDLNLAISFSFDVSNYKNINSIDFDDFTITNDNGKVIYRSVFKEEENIENVPIYTSASWDGSSVKTSDTTFSNSILIGLKTDIEKFEKIYCDVKSIKISYPDNRVEKIDGNWNFEIEISEEMRNSPKIVYTLKEENEYIESCKVTVANTGTILELVSKVDMPQYDTSDLANWPVAPARVYLNTKLDQAYRCLNSEYNEKYINASFNNIGIQDLKDIRQLELYIGFFNITLFLDREDV